MGITDRDGQLNPPSKLKGMAFYHDSENRPFHLDLFKPVVDNSLRSHKT